MRRLLQVFFLALFLVPAANAQITLTQSMFETAFAPGQTFVEKYSDTSTSIDIGSPGQNAWDFRAFSNLPMTSVTEYVLPSSTPYTSDFPSATHSWHFAEDGSDIYLYWVLANNELRKLGLVSNTPAENTVMTIKFTPTEIFAQFPATYNTMWSGSVNLDQIIEVNGSPLPVPFTTTRSIDDLIDAYGTMILPDGRSMAALRIKETAVTTISGIGPDQVSTEVTFVFIAASGDNFSVSLDDPNAGGSGVVMGTPAWGTTQGGGGVAVESYDGPGSFSLVANYPNPFSEKSTIVFATETSGPVSVTVYDLLGRRVADLLHENLPVGLNRVEWDGTDARGIQVPGGVYVYRLTSDGGSISRTMVLTR